MLNYPRRLVLDTNVVLDWLVFANADVRVLTSAVATGGVQVMVYQAMLDELSRVLGYPLLKLDESRLRCWPVIGRKAFRLECPKHSMAIT